jgi:hypothetical protein
VVGNLAVKACSVVALRIAYLGIDDVFCSLSFHMLCFEMLRCYEMLQVQMLPVA